MQPRKNIWPQIFAAAGLETLTLICWLSKANPKLAKKLLILTVAVDLYLIPKTCSFFYNTYQKSKGLTDFLIKADIPGIKNFHLR